MHSLSPSRSLNSMQHSNVSRLHPSLYPFTFPTHSRIHAFNCHSHFPLLQISLSLSLPLPRAFISETKLFVVRSVVLPVHTAVSSQRRRAGAFPRSAGARLGRPPARRMPHVARSPLSTAACQTVRSAPRENNRLHAPPPSPPSRDMADTDVPTRAERARVWTSGSDRPRPRR